MPTEASANAREVDRLLAAMRLDKKVSDGQIKFVLARKIGEVLWGQAVPEELIRQQLTGQPRTQA